MRRHLTTSPLRRVVEGNGGDDIGEGTVLHKGVLFLVVLCIVVLGSMQIARGQGTVATCGGHTPTVLLANGDQPTDGPDVILGTDGPDVINAGAGNDIICSGDGDDIVRAGDGADEIRSGDGNDEVFAGQGRDVVFAGTGDDFVSGGRGKDIILGGAGDDDLRGNEGTDDLRGGDGRDELRGGQKADELQGNTGHDILIGGTRPDILRGNLGIDTYIGGGGIDTCLPDPNGATEAQTSCELAVEVIEGSTAEAQQLTSPPGTAQRGFGSAIAVSDGTMFVGARSAFGTAEGAVFVFVQTNDQWVLHQTLTSPNQPGSAPFFGSMLAAEGDTLVVDNGDGVIVFGQVNGDWLVQQVLGPFNPEVVDSIEIDGDTMALGVFNEVQSSVIIFTRANGIWSEQQRLTDPTVTTAHSFGGPIAIADGTMIVGEAVTSEAHIFDLVGDSWTHQQSLFKPDTINGDGFGSAIDIDDGMLVITDPSARRGGLFGQFEDGSAFVFTESDGVWVERQEIPDQVGQNRSAVDIDGELMAISSDDPRGSVKLYVLENDTWNQDALFVRSDAAPEGDTGLRIALDGDVVVVGAVNFAGNDDTVYIYDLALRR